MNKIFLQGFCLGVLLKDKFVSFLFNGLEHIYKITYNRNKITESNIYFVCKINDQELFEESFANNFQPGWKYFPEKKALKIKLDQEVFDHIIDKTPEELYEVFDSSGEYLISLDIELFNSFGTNYLYIEHCSDSRKYVNVYSSTEKILSSDFVIDKKKMLFNDVLCASLKVNDRTEYLTSFLKMFSNNTLITPEMVLLFNDSVDIDIRNVQLVTIREKSINNYGYHEILS
jgi:hypothetical protein